MPSFVMDRSGLPRLSLWLDDGPYEGAWNMAVDEALLRMAEVPVLRVYGWRRPMISVGIRFALAALPDSLRAWPVVRRPTGGGVVWHGADHTFTLVVPQAAALSGFDPRGSYQWIHSKLANALTKVMGEGLSLADQGCHAVDDRCFHAAVPWDVVRNGIKVAGGAQRRTRAGFLHQGSIQGIALNEAFWPVFADELADCVERFEAAPCLLAEASRLEEAQYTMAEWSRPAEGDSIL